MKAMGFLFLAALCLSACQAHEAGSGLDAVCAPALSSVGDTATGDACLAAAPTDLMGHSTDAAACEVDPATADQDGSEALACSLVPDLEEGVCRA